MWALHTLQIKSEICQLKKTIIRYIHSAKTQNSSSIKTGQSKSIEKTEGKQ